MDSSDPLHLTAARWRSATRKRLCDAFDITLDDANQVLMDKSEKAGNNLIQASFFQAQQEIHRRRDTLRQRFAHALSTLMDETPTTVEAAQHRQPAELKLINPEIFERQVVLQTIGERSAQRHYEVLHALGHRLSVLYRGNVIEPQQIPASPTQLLASFDDATRDLDIDFKAWQTLAILFDRHVLRQLQGRFDQLNDALREAGVLPNLKFQVTAQPASSASLGAPSAPDATAVQDHAAESAAADSNLSRIRDLLPGAAGQATRSHPGHLAATQIADIIEQGQQDFLALLPDHGLFTPGASDVHIGKAQLRDSQQAMRDQREAIKTEIGADKLSQYDDSTIDIIGALFEAMLEESELPSTIKALLSHLHTPYLKTAMREPELLGNAGHPARQLLDELVNAGENWGSGNDLGKGIFPTLKKIITTLRDSLSPSRNLFEQQRSLLLQKVGELRKHRDLRCDRVTEAEIGRSKLENAKIVAEDFIHQLLSSKSPCKPCQDFFVGPWQDYLTLLLLRNNGQPGGDGWKSSLKLGEHLAELSRSVLSPSPPSRDAVERLRKQLTQALGDLVPHYQVHIDSLMQTLQTLRDQDRQALPAATAETLSPNAVRPASSDTIEPPLDADELELLKELAETATGTSFVFAATDSDSDARRLTVTWFNHNTNRLLFVDQYGAKAELIAAPRLVRMMSQGVVYRIERKEKTSFVSRALQALRQYLEKNSMLKQGVAYE